MLVTTSLSIVLFRNCSCPCFYHFINPRTPPKFHLCNYHPRSWKIPIRMRSSSQLRKNKLKTLVLASKKWLVEQHLTQDASRSPHIHRSVTAARGLVVSESFNTDGFVRVQQGARVERVVQEHLALWKKSFLEIVEFTRYITTWLPDKSFLIGFNPYF